MWTERGRSRSPPGAVATSISNDPRRSQLPAVDSMSSQAATLQAFFDDRGPDRTAQVHATSMDLHGGNAKVTRQRAPSQALRHEAW